MCLPSNGKREHFSETTVDSRLLVSRADKLRGTRKPRVQPVSPLVASRIGHPSSKLGPRLLLDTATRCGEEGKRETSLREEATSHRGVFTREFNLCALLYSNEQVCRVQSRNTKKTSNVVPAIPLRRYIYSPLSKSVLSRPRVVFAEEIVSRMARFQFFLPNYSSLPTSVRIPFSFEYSGSRSTFTFV